MSLFIGLIGGVLIGLGAVTLMMIAGRIAGISGIAGGVLFPHKNDWLWRVVFLLGLLFGAWLVGQYWPAHFEISALNNGVLALSAFLVGFGAILANGCTSGHGVCGLARMSRRSMVAVGVFMSVAIITVWVVRHGV